MKIDHKLIEKLAKLAHLKLDAEEETVMLKDLNKILELVNKLKEIDTEGVEPLVYLTQETVPLRADIVKSEFSKEEVLKNAPVKNSDFVIVPKVVRK